jgi:hypothetical protein
MSWSTAAWEVRVRLRVRVWARVRVRVRVRVPGAGCGMRGAACRVRSAGCRVQARLIERGAGRRGVPVTLDALVRGEDPAVGTPPLELVVDEDAVISTQLSQAAVRLCVESAR